MSPLWGRVIPSDRIAIVAIVSAVNSTLCKPESKAGARLLPLREVAERLGLSYRYVRRVVANGELAGINVTLGERPTWRVTEEDLEAFIESRRQAGAAS